MMDFDGKSVLVTGASSGIGRAAASRFAKAGARTILVARRAGLLEELRDEIGNNALAIACDITDEKQVADMADFTLSKCGTPDILLNNAGIIEYGTVSEQKIGQIKSQMDTNYMGMVRCTKAFLPKMIERGSGQIINIASVGASVGAPGIAPYCASKFAMLGFSEGLQYELEGTGVGITVISPIMVRTKFIPDGARRSRASVSAESVADAILKASGGTSRFEITVPQAARIILWMRAALPHLTEPLIKRIFKSQLGPITKGKD